ncbi:hypothetical protein BDV26DRAFT_290878 [Aspergillus bertholletiae]|uniref:Uncharacterized protein n=1 Tax=Aspergillus bertholletiae TaxID=1226010 RepID=A0A5N7BDM5_9EURO|nr:hypothetical protein BDV26DRAFT_290878 [Aspergillus bertholletiae]
MSDLAIQSTSSSKSTKPLIVAGHTFSSPNEVFSQLRTRPPVGNEVLTELDVRKNSMGLLSTGSEIIEVPIGGPGFEWTGTEPQLPLPQAIIEELSDLSSDSEHEDAESLQGTQAPPTITVEPTATPTSTTLPTSTRRQKRKREKAPMLTASSSGQRQPSQRTTSDSHISPHGDTSRLTGSPGAPSSLQSTKDAEFPSSLQDVGVQNPLETLSGSNNIHRPLHPPLPSPLAGIGPKGKEGETAAETHPETQIRDDEAAHKSTIMEALLKRFKASNIDPKRVLAESDKKTTADCAVIELKRFEHHYKNQLNSYQFSLFQHQAEIDPVLWLLQALFSSDTELLAFPQGVEKVIPNHDGIVLPPPPPPTVCQYGSGATLLPIKNADLNTAVVLRPNLLPVPVIMELSKGALHSKFRVVEAIQKIRSEREPVSGDLRDLSTKIVTFVEHSPILQGISPLSDAILCRRSYLEVEVQEEMRILLGEDWDTA